MTDVTLAEDLLVLPLPIDLEGTFALDVSYLVHGEPTFAERLEGAIPSVDGTPEQPKVISLLAWHPSVATKLDAFHMAGAVVTVVWELDRGTSGAHDLAELIFSTKEAQFQGPSPSMRQSFLTADRSRSRHRST